MRLLAVTLVAMLTLVVVSCSSGETASDGTALTGDELGWCGDPNDFDAYDAIWEAADESGVASMGDFMLEKAGIETDIDPKDLAALTASLSREQIDALVAVGDEFDESDDLWLEYLATEDGTAACRAAYAASN
jgi:ABC-type proline/glycine betaine transport system substrate-binding protein